MTALQTFIDFAKTFPKDRLGELDAELTDLMLRLQAPQDWALSPEQEDEINRRLADPNPKYATTEEVNEILSPFKLPT